jgi:hypothetical protein
VAVLVAKEVKAELASGLPDAIDPKATPLAQGIFDLDQSIAGHTQFHS